MSLLKIPGAILAHARHLVGAGEPAPFATPAIEPTPASERRAEDEWDMQRHNKSFWTSMVAADRRLAELRRAIDQAAAEADAREARVEATSDPGLAPGGHLALGESRCEMAARVITNALGAEKS